MGTALDPSGLLAGTTEVLWWALCAAPGVLPGPAERAEATARGSKPVAFRLRLLDAWAEAGHADHARLRAVYPEYAGAMMKWQHGGVSKVTELLDALEADVADIREARTARRQTFIPVRRG